MKILKRVLKWGGLLFLVVFVASTAFAFWVNAHVKGRLSKHYDVPPVAFTVDVSKADLALGERIVHVRGGCVECHGDDLAGGTVIEDPMAGRVYGPNITPHKLKDWTDGEIARAIRHGLKKDGTPAVIMPANDYQHLSEGDLAAVVRYLRTVPALDKPDRGAQLGPVVKVLIAMKKAPQMITAEIVSHSGAFPEKPAEGPTKEFGHYLFEGACLGCHKADLSGGPIVGAPPDWAVASNLTPARLGHWKEADFLATIRTGKNPDGKVLQFPMNNIAKKYLSQYTDVEAKALWAYVSSVPPVDADAW